MPSAFGKVVEGVKWHRKRIRCVWDWSCGRSWPKMVTILGAMKGSKLGNFAMIGKRLKILILLILVYCGYWAMMFRGDAGDDMGAGVMARSKWEERKEKVRVGGMWEKRRTLLSTTTSTYFFTRSRCKKRSHSWVAQTQRRQGWPYLTGYAWAQVIFFAPMGRMEQSKPAHLSNDQS